MKRKRLDKLNFASKRKKNKKRNKSSKKKLQN